MIHMNKAQLRIEDEDAGDDWHHSVATKLGCGQNGEVFGAFVAR